MQQRPKIDAEKIKRIVFKEFKAARWLIKNHPGEEMKPRLLVITGDLFDDSRWKFDCVVFSEFNENRYDLLAIVAEDYASKDSNLVGVVLVSEVWMSMVRGEDIHKPRVEPRNDPERKEALMAAAITLDLQTCVAQATFERKQGEVIFEEMAFFDPTDGRAQYKILEHFMRQYAVAKVERWARLN